jgi:hypothetical protein
MPIPTQQLAVRRAFGGAFQTIVGCTAGRSATSDLNAEAFEYSEVCSKPTAYALWKGSKQTNPSGRNFAPTGLPA